MKSERHAFSGQGVLITGAAGGFGRAMARAFCAHGARVALLDRDAAAVEAAASELVDAGFQALAIAADITREVDVARAAEAAAAGGGVHVLVNNAGIASVRDIRTVTADEWGTTLGVNLTGQFLVTRAVVEPMVARGSGVIINIASLAGKRGGGILGKVAYATSKAGLIGFTRAVARELAPHGIRVNGIAPGAMDTEMTRVFREQPDLLATVVAGVPLGRLGQPEDVANLAVFLASNRSAYITGQTINLDGGILME